MLLFFNLPTSDSSMVSRGIYSTVSPISDIFTTRSELSEPTTSITFNDVFCVVFELVHAATNISRPVNNLFIIFFILIIQYHSSLLMTNKSVRNKDSVIFQQIKNFNKYY